MSSPVSKYRGGQMASRTARRFVVAAMLLFVVFGSLFATQRAFATPLKQTPQVTYSYTILESKVCNMQGHFGASFRNPFDPFSAYCYDLSFPIGFTMTGGLDMQGYCNSEVPGSTAVVTNPNWAYQSWACQITV
jgi:hypothetical protein